MDWVGMKAWFVVRKGCHGLWAVLRMSERWDLMGIDETLTLDGHRWDSREARKIRISMVRSGLQHRY